MGRGAKPTKPKVKAKLSVNRKPPKNQGARVRDLERRLVEALEREKAKDRALIEALEQQAATAEILRIISSSPADVQPVFDAIAEAAMRLCGAHSSLVTRFDGELLHLVAQADISPQGREVVRDVYPRRPSRGSASGRTVLTRAIVQISDLTADPEYDVGVVPRVRDFRSILAVPMLRDGLPIGSINAHKAQPGPFTDKQVALLKTFADQAVIAIENVRLFKELQERNRDLAEALDEQTATSDILRVISASRTDVHPVFEAIVQSAVHLLRAHSGMLTRITGEQLELAAFTSIGEAYDNAMRTYWPRPLNSKGAHILAIRDRAPVNIADAASDPRVPEDGRAVVRLHDIRSVVSVPLLRHGEAIGTIAVNRIEPGGFTDAEIALLQTFADQAVIAIENVRLFKELEAANRDLAAASQHKSEFLANMSHELRTPLNAIIGYSELLEEEAGDLDGGRLVPDLQKIATAAKHQLSLINDILDLSKIEAGRMELELANFDLPNTIDNALILVRERASRRGIDLGSSIDRQLGVISGDERKVKQVLLNLLSNALKFTPDGGRIDVSARVHDEVAEVSVADTGVGIAPEDQEAIFEEFRQVGRADKKVEGTGLGLALSRKFIELHGGRIWVKSQVEHGSTFTFTIRMRRDPSD